VQSHRQGNEAHLVFADDLCEVGVTDVAHGRRRNGRISASTHQHLNHGDVAVEGCARQVLTRRMRRLVVGTKNQQVCWCAALPECVPRVRPLLDDRVELDQTRTCTGVLGVKLRIQGSCLGCREAMGSHLLRRVGCKVEDSGFMFGL
jgi:hypothetical protein